MAKKKKKVNAPYYIFLLVLLLFTGFFYISNLTRDIYGGDVGDLVVSSFVAGVAHPPGYPLFTLLGIIFSRLPLPLPVVSLVGLISVISSLLFLALFYVFSFRISKSIVISFLSSSILAFSYLFWFYTEIPEVFALNNLICLVLLYFAYLFYEEKKARFLYIAAFFAGLGMTNHHTVVLLFPSVLILVFSHYKLFLKEKKLILFSILSFLAGLLPYVYVPIAASTNPIINWDDASTFRNFVRLVLRQDYGTFSAGIFDRANMSEQVVVMKNYFISIISSLTFPGTLVAVLGFTYLFKKKLRLGLAILLAFILAGPFFIFYSGFPLLNSFTIGASERFYVLSLVILALALPFGFVLIKETLMRFLTKKELAVVVLLGFFIIPALLLRYNSQKTDLSKTELGNELARDILRILPENAAIFMTGDTAIFNTWYAHYVLEFRDDVLLMQLGNARREELFEEARDEYIKENSEEKDEFRIFYGSLLTLGEKKPVFLSSHIGPPFSNISLVPWGLTLQPVGNGMIPDEETYIKRSRAMWRDINPPERDKLTIAERNLTTSDIPRYYAEGLVRTGNFIFQEYKNNDEALYYFNEALRVDPLSSKAYSGLAALEYEVYKDCSSAENHIKRAIELNTIERYNYLLLYLIYRDCFRDPNKVAGFKNYFKETFKRDIEQEFNEIAP